jgi:hypothetical protein
LLAVGDRFIGRYTCVESFRFFELSQDGQLELEVLGAEVNSHNQVNITVLVELMGEIDYSLYYASAVLALSELDQTSTPFNLQFQGETNFNSARIRPSLQGQLAVGASRLNYNGSLSSSGNGNGNSGKCDGTFNAHRVCHLPELGQVFEVGDQWVGTFLCADRLGATTSTRADIIITNVSDDGTVFKGLYDFTGEGDFQGGFAASCWWCNG